MEKKYLLIILDENLKENLGGAYLSYRVFSGSTLEAKKYFYCHNSRFHRSERLLIEEDLEKFLGESFANEFKNKFSDLKSIETAQFINDMPFFEIGKKSFSFLTIFFLDSTIFLIFIYSNHDGRNSVLLDIQKEKNKDNIKLKLSFEKLIDFFWEFLSKNKSNTLLLFFESCNGQGFWDIFQKRLSELDKERVSFLGYVDEGHLWRAKKNKKGDVCRNFGGFLSLVFQNSLANLIEQDQFEFTFRKIVILLIRPLFKKVKLIPNSIKRC